MFKLFEKESIVAYFILLSLLLLITSKVIFFSEVVRENQSSLLFYNILKAHEWNISYVRGLLLCIVLINFLLFSSVYRDFSFYPKSNLIGYFVVSVHTLVVLSFPIRLEDFFSVMFFYILSLKQLSADKEKDTTKCFFYIGLVYAISIVVSGDMLFYLFPMFFALFIFGRNGMRDFLAMLIGILAPIIILWSVVVMQDNNEFYSKVLSILKHMQYDLLTRYEWLTMGILVVSFIIAQSVVNSFTISTRKYYTHLFLGILALVPYYFLISSYGAKPHYLMYTYASFYLLPTLYMTRSDKVKSYMLFFGLFLAFFATFVQFK